MPFQNFIKYYYFFLSLDTFSSNSVMECKQESEMFCLNLVSSIPIRPGCHQLCLKHHKGIMLTSSWNGSVVSKHWQLWLKTVKQHWKFLRNLLCWDVLSKKICQRCQAKPCSARPGSETDKGSQGGWKAGGIMRLCRALNSNLCDGRKAHVQISV